MREQLNYGQKDQVHFLSLNEYYYTLGFLANGRRTDLYWEHNEDQGAWGSEGRIHCYSNLDEFPDVFDFTAGRGRVVARVNCNDYVNTLISDHNFSFNGEQNDIVDIQSTVPDEYLTDFLNGLKA